MPSASSEEGVVSRGGKKREGEKKRDALSMVEKKKERSCALDRGMGRSAGGERGKSKSRAQGNPRWFDAGAAKGDHLKNPPPEKKCGIRGKKLTAEKKE